MTPHKRIPRRFIDELLLRVNIVDIVSTRIALKKKGSNHTANCPFHLEKTPSFSVSEAKQFYHCFGCGIHGNAIDFLMHYDHLNFIEAIETLAAYTGMAVPQSITESTKDPDYNNICQTLGSVADFYHENLLHTQKAVDYVKSRGLTKAIIKKYTIGYAPAGWHTLVKKEKGILPKLITSGMVIQKDQSSFYDRFRDRLMFPIRDSRGQVIAFGGRTLSDDTPKYLNSPETSVFHKGKALYGFYEARQTNQPLQYFIVVEGYMDVIALAQYGFHHAVATLGTAISREQIQKLLRHTATLFFCFDGDRAGYQAAWRAVEISLPLLRDDIRMRFVFLNPEDDPDTFVRREGCEAFQAKLDKAVSLPDFFFSALAQKANPESLDGRAHLGKLATNLFEKMPNGLFKQLMYDALAHHLKINPEQLHSPDPATPPLTQKIAPLSPSRAGQLAVSLLLQHPHLAEKVTTVTGDPDDRHSLFLTKLIELAKQNPGLTTGGLLEYWREHRHAPYLSKLASWTHPLPASAVEAEFLGALLQMRNQYREKQIQALLNKAQTSGLSPEEKETLQTLILQKNTED